MAIHKSDAAKGITPIPYGSIAGHVVAKRYTFLVPANIVEGDIIELAPIPAGHRVIDMIFESEDLDSGTPAILWDIGIMSGSWQDGGARTSGAEFFSGSTVSQGGTAARPTLPTAFRTGTAANDRSIGAKLATDAATAVAGTIGLTVLYVAE